MIRSSLRAVAAVAGWTAVAALLATLTAVTVASLAGYRVMVVTGGSMSPAIGSGDAVVLCRVPAERIGPGDVIAFRSLENGRITTHRVVDRRTVSGELHFRTQGDANATPDANLAPGRAVLGRVCGQMPAGGLVVAVLTTPIARLGVIALPALAIVAMESVALWRDLRLMRKRQAIAAMPSGPESWEDQPVHAPRSRPRTPARPEIDVWEWPAARQHAGVP